MAIPIISLMVVMNGPVATAGSIFRRLKPSGSAVPTMAANKTTVISDRLTAMLNAKSWQRRCYKGKPMLPRWCR